MVSHTFQRIQERFLEVSLPGISGEFKERYKEYQEF